MSKINPRTHKPQQNKKLCWCICQFQSLCSGNVAGTIIMFRFPSFIKKGCFQYKTENVNTTIEFCIFELVLVPNFSLNWQFSFFGPNLPKKRVSGLKQKSEQRHWILHTRVSLGTKFQPKLTILIFFNQICPKKEFLVENGKSTLVRASMVVTYYTKLFHTGADRQRYFNVSSPSSHRDNNIKTSNFLSTVQSIIFFLIWHVLKEIEFLLKLII